MRRLSILLALLIPSVVLAYDYSSWNLPYKDTSNTAEKAAVSVLTSEAVVSGYPDGTFGYQKSLNRAEFLKIALMARYANFADAVNEPTSACFPDVKPDQWFAVYVCYAKGQGVIGGYPDGMFHPERSVNYAEALKMLGNLFNIRKDVPLNSDWYVTFREGAYSRGVGLPGMEGQMSMLLKRGQMARLTAAYMAESKGELDEYRQFEKGMVPMSSSSSMSSSASSAMSSSAMSSSSSSAMSSSASSTGMFNLPAKSQFALVGSVTNAIADGVIKSVGEPAHIRTAEVKLFNEVLSLENMELVTDKGVVLGTLIQKVNDGTTDYKLTYQMTLAPGQDYPITADTDVHMVLRAKIRSIDNNGAADQLLHVRTFNVSIQKDNSNTTQNFSLAGPFPKNVTSFGRIVSVMNAGPTSGTLASGTGKTIASFLVNGAMITGKEIAIENIVFNANIMGDVVIGSVKLSRGDTGQIMNCSLNSSTISCDGITAGIGALNPSVTLNVIANVLVGPTGGTLQLELPSSGSPEQLGSLQWTDNSGHYKWVELATPIAKSTFWQKN